jgi:hypothetical protein
MTSYFSISKDLGLWVPGKRLESPSPDAEPMSTRSPIFQVVDLRNVQCISADGLVWITHLHMELEHRNGQLRMAGGTPVFFKKFPDRELLRFFHWDQDLVHALRTLSVLHT